MADFEIAYGETELHEGGYVNDPVDRGGETHRGISRRFHPDWPGWKIVDELKKKHPSNFKQKINENQKLVELAKAVYKANYWNPILGDQFSNQHLANKVFDSGVNLGVARSVKFLQTGLNLLNRNQKNYEDVSVDGKMGEKSLKAMQDFLKLEKGRPDFLLKILNVLQANHYLDIMRNNPSQQRFARGWLNRVDLR